MYPKRLIKNPRNPAARDRREAFEYHLALCCLDDEPLAQVVALNGRVITTADGDNQLVVTVAETLTYEGSNIPSAGLESAFVFGTNENGDGVYWYVLPA